MEEKLAQQPGSVIRVVLFGPESTGKTTLAKELATFYKTQWVPEFMRAYLQDKWDTQKKICELEDMPVIGEGQMESENRLVKEANKILICDTNLMELKVYSEAYYREYCDPRLEKYALENTYALYFLTFVDVPWVPDDLRDKPGEREEMFERFERTLKAYNKPYVVLKGNREERFREAVNQINKLLTGEHYV